MIRQVFTTGLALPEAPLLMPDDSWLVAELAFDSGRVIRVSADGKEHSTVAETGRPKGLALGRDGSVWICETLTPAVLRRRPDGSLETVVTELEGEPLRWPNDLCFGPDGLLYVTDSGLLVRELLDDDGKPLPGCEDFPMNGTLFRINPETGDAEKLDEGFRFTNGIAFGPDGLLYVNETMTGNVYRYEVAADGGIGPRETFGSVLDPAWTGSGMRGPDGMAFGEDGRLFVAVFGQGDVTVLGGDGAVLEHRPLLGKAPTNVAFGRRGTNSLYVVEDELGQIECYDVGVDGIDLYD